ncbi:Cytosol aminopeptidase [Zancudomyces culisetae]|uniref:Cytosol aminopeptidase n=1 Tax=Zancudomyces culisetae TaxID=1213189 RepID=A0A1R1PHP7_ZANCU|nr:Cytosol aminopeptidase [Zancudomyces culisetae]|eukprot:OMH80477.1 Cytosol aminopeptidase [Zancudomyces culisetae]
MFANSSGKFQRLLSIYSLNSIKTQYRTKTTKMAKNLNKGLVVGIYNDFKLSFEETNPQFLTKEISSMIIEEVKARQLKCKPGDFHVFYEKAKDSSEFLKIAVVGLGGKDSPSPSVIENVRSAVGTGVRNLRELNVENIQIDPSLNPQGAAEGAYLGSYKYDVLKTNKKEKAGEMSIEQVSSEQANLELWEKGKIYAESQNWARTLAFTPANLMTPTIFGEECVKELTKFENVTVNVHDKEWAEKHKMGAFLSVAVGSDQPPKFVEIIYKGGKEGEQPIVYVGKGITFDTGGISIKPSRNMDLMKGDMGGAASVVAAMRGIAALKLPINAVCCVPLAENMPSEKATKPGDVVVAMNGKTIEVIDTDAEGRMALADALTYAVEYHNPYIAVDVATLTGAMVVALGDIYTGVFTPSNQLWSLVDAAATVTSDKAWRMPLNSDYMRLVESQVADIANYVDIFGAGANAAAVFLREFVSRVKNTDNGAAVERERAEEPSEALPKWAHMDIAGTMETEKNSGHHVRGMTGRPTRLLIEMANLVPKKQL